MRDYHSLNKPASAGENIAGLATVSRSSIDHDQLPTEHSFEPKKFSFNEQKVYSTRSRYIAILENLQKSADYVREQQKALNEIIQQFQLLTGYLEQTDLRRGVSTHTWSVYFMHVQVVQECMKRTFSDKPLFDQGNHSPLRIHVPVDGEIVHYDLPLPSLRSIIPLGAFIHGSLDRSLPSIGLIEDCMTAVTSCLLEIQGARIFISDSTRECRTLRDKASVQPKLPAFSPVVRIVPDREPQHVQKPTGFRNWIQSFIPSCLQAT